MKYPGYADFQVVNSDFFQHGNNQSYWSILEILHEQEPYTDHRTERDNSGYTYSTNHTIALKRTRFLVGRKRDDVITELQSEVNRLSRELADSIAEYPKLKEQINIAGKTVEKYEALNKKLTEDANLTAKYNSELKVERENLMGHLTTIRHAIGDIQYKEILKGRL